MATQLSIFDELAAREKEAQLEKEKEAQQLPEPIDQTIRLGCMVKTSDDIHNIYRVGAIGLGMVGLMLPGISQVFNKKESLVTEVVANAPDRVQHYLLKKGNKRVVALCEYHERTKHIWSEWADCRILVTA